MLNCLSKLFCLVKQSNGINIQQYCKELNETRKSNSIVKMLSIFIETIVNWLISETKGIVVVLITSILNYQLGFY